MKRRTQVVKTFELKALHNQKRVNAWITMPGYDPTVASLSP